MIVRVLLFLAMLLAPLGAGAQQVSFEKGKLEVVDSAGTHHPFTIEFATTQEQLSQGLMFRKSLAPDAGMLFDFGHPRLVAMWMKNTLIPLDMLFMDKGGTIIHIEEFTVPGSLEPRGPQGAVLGVLEVAGGTARRLKIKVGDRVIHPLFGSR
jgi:uncharacterized membrane protein (UPF0127 family)